MRLTLRTTELHHATLSSTMTACAERPFADMNCSVAQSLEVIGEWWTLLILRDAFLGVTRFDDFAKRLGIARNVLTARLDTLVDARRARPASPTTRPAAATTTASPTRAGRSCPVLTAIRQWGDEWILGEDQAPIVVEHTTCGHLSKGVLTCDHCGEELTTRTLRARRGPGYQTTSGCSLPTPEPLGQASTSREVRSTDVRVPEELGPLPRRGVVLGIV